MAGRKSLLPTLIGILVLGVGFSPASSADVPPKAYVIAEIDVKDPDAYRAYVDAAFPVIQKYGGTFLTRGGQTISVEGRPPAQRVMIIEFASLAQAKAFEFSKDYTDIAPLRQRSADSRLFIVEGVTEMIQARP